MGLVPKDNRKLMSLAAPYLLQPFGLVAEKNNTCLNSKLQTSTQPLRCNAQAATPEQFSTLRATHDPSSNLAARWRAVFSSGPTSTRPGSAPDSTRRPIISPALREEFWGAFEHKLEVGRRSCEANARQKGSRR